MAKIEEYLNDLKLTQVNGYYIIEQNENYGLGFSPTAPESEQFAVYTQERVLAGFDNNDNPIEDYTLTNPTYYANRTALGWYNFEQVYDLTPPTSQYGKLYNMFEAAPNNEPYYKIDVTDGKNTVESLYFNSEEKYIAQLKDFNHVGRSAAMTATHITKEEYQQYQQEHLHSLNLKQNAGYHILDETQHAAIGFSPTAPDKLVIWSRDSDGDYISGHYGSTFNLFEIADLRFRGFDMDKVTGILNDIGFDYSEGEKTSPLSMVKSRFIQETKDLMNDVEKWLDNDTSYLNRNDPVEKNIIERAMKLQGASYVLSPIIGENTHDKIVAAVNYIYPRAIDVNALNTAVDFIGTIEEFGETYQENSNLYERIRTRLSLEVHKLMAAVREWDNSDARRLSLDTDHFATNDVNLKAMLLRGASDILAPVIGNELNEKIFKSTEIVKLIDFESSAMRDIIAEIKSYDMSNVDEISVANVPPSDEHKFDSIEIPSYTDTWSSVGELQVDGDTYYLMENDRYGDETQYLIIDSMGNVITNEVYNGFEEPEFVEYLENIAADKNPVLSQQYDLGHHPIDIEQSSVNEIIEGLQEKVAVAEEENKSNNSIQLKSIVTQTYESDPITHVITDTHTRTGQEVFDELSHNLSSNGLMPEEYFLLSYEGQLPKDAEFIVNTNYGPSEGIYIEIFFSDGEQSRRFATGKTLRETDNDFMQMSSIGATMQLLLNGNGRIIELAREPTSSRPTPPIDPSKKTVYVCSPLAGEIEANIAKAREYSKFVAMQGGTPIAPHITEIFNDLIPEERALGLAMGIDYLRKADELWVFGDIISNGMSAEIIIAQRDLQIPVFHVDDKTYEKVLFNDYKASQPVNQNINNKEVSPMAENFTRDQLNRAKDVDLLNYVQTHGYAVKAHGSCYKLIEDGHDSTVIFPSTNSWSNMATGVGGDIVSFLVKHEGKDMVAAVKELIGETFDPQKMFEKSKESILSREPLVLPPKAEDNRRVYAYLLQTRGLDRDIVHQAIHDGIIYQSKETIAKGDKEYVFNNCIFVGKDNAGTAQYASQRSMNDNSTFNFKQDVKNSNKAFGFKLLGKATADWLTVCEAPIDALSIASLNKLKRQPTDDEHILSLGGVSDKAIDKFLESHKNIKVINICLDNDEAGRAAGEKFKEKYSALGYKIVESYPKEKDYNLELKKAIEVKNTPVADAPDKAENNRRAFMYLTGTKMLDEDLIKARLSDSTIYQSDREVQKINGDLIKHANMVFVQRDKNGSILYAIEISQNANLGKADFKIEYKNESQAGNYLSRVGENSTLLVFSNPISQLSYQTATKDVGLIPKSNYLCCITNQSEAISEFIEQNPHIKNVQVMLDKASVLSHKTNQLVDYREFAFKKIKKELGEKGIPVSKKYPQGIDWNKDMLLLKQQSAQAKKAAATDKNKEQGMEIER